MEGREEKKYFVKNRKSGKKLLSEYIIHFTTSVKAKYFQGENVVPVLFNVALFLPGERAYWQSKVSPLFRTPLTKCPSLHVNV